MKKRLIIPLAAMLCLSLAGCGGDSPAPEPSAADETYAGIRTESRFSPNSESSEAPRQPAASAEPNAAPAPSAAVKNAGSDTGGGSSGAARTENNETAAEQNAATSENADISSASSSENSAENAPADGESAVRPEQQSAAPENSKNTCAFLIDCSKALEYTGLSDGLRSALPRDGVLYGGSPEVKDGDSVFDLLQRITRENGIPMEFSSSPGFGSKYIEGINSLYEFDCGPNSGWVYFVNGEKPGVGCDKYEIKPGDDVRWYYTLDLGNDIGLDIR